ncbi:MAG: hypothetical protein Q4E24_00605, partial [bacterium]|nr:hypothetical protein [bacterium]
MSLDIISAQTGFCASRRKPGAKILRSRRVRRTGHNVARHYICANWFLREPQKARKNIDKNDKVRLRIEEL